MEIDKDRVGTSPERASVELPVDRPEGAVELGHEDAAHRVHDQNFGAVARLVEPGAAPRRAGGIVERTQQTRLALDEDESFALVPTVVAKRDCIGTRRQQVVANRFGDAEATGGILTVDHHEIEFVALDQVRQQLDHHVAAAAANYVTKKQEAHIIRPNIARIRTASESSQVARHSRDVAQRRPPTH